MKTATKIFMILSLIAASLYSFIGLIILFAGFLVVISGDIVAIGIVIGGLLLVSMIAPSLIVTIIGLRKLSRAKCADDISTGWKIAILILSNIISGIMLLCMKDDDYLTDAERMQRAIDKNNEMLREQKEDEEQSEKEQEIDGFDEIIKLKKLLDNGLITEEEYSLKKKQILGI